VQFKAAGIKDAAPGENRDKAGAKQDIDFKIKTKELKLKNDWQRYELVVDERSAAENDLKSVAYPFGFEIRAQQTDKVRIYLHGITIDTEEPEFPTDLEP
jgi:hypothetical protein